MSKPGTRTCRARFPRGLLHLSVLLLIGLGGDAQPQEQYVLSTSVELVVLNAAVRNRKGQVASDLHQQDFEIYEDGVRQSIRVFKNEDIPVTVGLVVDHSGSMQPKLNDVEAAARMFVQTSSPADEMCVINFNDTVTLGLPPDIRFTNRVNDLVLAIARTRAVGQTKLYDAIFKAQEQLQEGSRDKKVLIVVSDGGDNASTHTLVDVLKRAEQSTALIYAVGIFDAEDPDKNPGVLKRLAQATGGESYFPAERSAVVSVCERIAWDIRHQYTLAYVASNTSPSKAFRKIRVAARNAQNEKLVVRTRTGYFPSGNTGRAPDRGAK